VNKVFLVGNLGVDPETRDLPSGQRVTNLRVATSENIKDSRTGGRKEHTEWHTVAVFDPNSIHYAEQFLRKGDKIYVEGRVQTRKWQDQSGSNRYSTEIVVNSVGGKLVGLSSREEAGSTTDEISDRSTPQSDDLGGDVPF
jgi:single-strand DNA-binding protein